MTKILYLSYDGLTDPLGQSQIMPYLLSLAKLDHSITIVSFEKKERKIQTEEINSILDQYSIDWIPLSYTKKPPVLSTIYDLLKLRKITKKIIVKKNIRIVHCRSYLCALIGQWAKKRFNTRFIFDMRGFWADERVEGGLWNIKNPIYKTIYRFFKKKEREFLEDADCTITLTYKAKEIIHSWDNINNNPVSISVIPCCVDLEIYNPDLIKQQDVIRYKSQLGILDKDFILMYLGSVGTWYMLDEMMGFFKELKVKNSDAKFLFVTKESPEFILKAADRVGIERKDILITSAKRFEVPIYLSLSSASIYFIRPSFSKQASSPTKHGEILAMNKPIITNAGVGDWEFLKVASLVGVVEGFDRKYYNSLINKLRDLRPLESNRENLDYFDLNRGVKIYADIYKKVAL